MIPRRLAAQLQRRLAASPVVALLGPRQVGKTTLAKALAEQCGRPCTYLDLERPSDRNKLADPELFLARQEGHFCIIDEVQRQPDLFTVLRSVVDERIAKGEATGLFLLLGSASRDLLRQSAESLAGRIAYLELAPFTLDELPGGDQPDQLDRLWLRGGFPGSLLAADEADSLDWRLQFVQTYLERDLPQLGLRLPSALTQRFWSMLAHGQGSQWNAARLASGLGVSGHSVRHYLDILTELFMVRQLPAWSGNSQKRLVKSPKVYVRDTGIAHALAAIPDLDVLLGHPLCGPSWEAFVLENTLAHLPKTWRASYYRSAAQAEIDLVLEGPRGDVLAIEIKRSLTPSISKGFRLGYDDIGATRGFFVVPAGDRYPLMDAVEVVPLWQWIAGLPQIFD
jgi:predicted AAA+ superfamily ATPase